MKNIKTRITLSALLTVCMIFTLTPSVAFGAGAASETGAGAVTTAAASSASGSEADVDAVITAAGEGSGSQTTETAAVYCLCTMEKNYETGKKELTPADEGGHDAYIGQTKEIVLAQKVTGSTSPAWEEVSAAAAKELAIEWKLSQQEDYVSELSGSSGTKKSCTMLKESGENQAIITATVTPKDGSAADYSFNINVCDGYNPGFDPDDEDEVIAIIDAAEAKTPEEAGAVKELNAGGQAEGTVSYNDEYCIFRFRTNKSRFFNFYSVNSTAPCCAYLYSYDSEPPEEMKRDKTCDLIYADEDEHDDFSITGDDYKNPLEENFESTAYYLIVKYYRSSSLGNITVRCDISSTGGIYDPYLYYTVNEGSTAQEVSVYEGFNYSDKDSKYVASEMLPYNCNKSSDIYLKYLDSKENVKVANKLTEGRNTIAEAGDYTYVLDLTFEKSADMLFEASIYRDDDKDEWESDVITNEDFDTNGSAVISLPRNAVGKSFVLRLESICSSTITKEGGEPDSIVEIPFTADEAGNTITFSVSSADGTTSKVYTVNTVENQPLGIDQMTFDYYGKSSASGDEDRSSSTIVFGTDFASDNTLTVYVPAWFGKVEARRLVADIYTTDDNAATDFSSEGAYEAAAKAADEGTVQPYTFSVFDSTSKEKYSRTYKLNFATASTSSADLRYAYMTWLDPEDDSEQKEKVSFISGSGTSSDPKKAAFRMPEGVTITNEYFETTLSAFAKECGVIYYDDDGYIETGNYLEYSLAGESKSETVKFMIVSPNRKNKVYYQVTVYDYDKGYGKGTVFRTDSGKYKVTGTGSSPEVSLIGAPSGTEVNMAATVTSGETAYKVTAIGAKAFKGRTVTSVTVSSGVRKIGASAFTGAKKLKTLKISTTKLTKAGVKNSLKGSSVTTVKCTGSAAKKSVIKKYKKIFTKSNCGRSVKVK